MGTDRIGSDPMKEYSHYAQPQLRVITSNGFKVLKSVVYFDLFTVVSSADVILKSVLPNKIKKKINFVFF